MGAFGTVFKGGWGGVAFIGSVVVVATWAAVSCVGGAYEGGKALLKAPPEGSTRIDEATKAMKRGAVGTATGGIIDIDKSAEENADKLGEAVVEKGWSFTKKAASAGAAVVGGAIRQVGKEIDKEFSGAAATGGGSKGKTSDGPVGAFEPSTKPANRPNNDVNSNSNVSSSAPAEPATIDSRQAQRDYYNRIPNCDERRMAYIVGGFEPTEKDMKDCTPS